MENLVNSLMRKNNYELRNCFSASSVFINNVSLLKGAVITIGESMGVSPGESQSKNQDGDIVPTVDTVRYSFLAALLLLNKNPLLITG